MNDHIDSFVTKSWFTVRHKAFNLYYTPLFWNLGWLDRRVDKGTFIYHQIHFLCFQLECETLSKYGAANRRYREELKKSGEWNPDRERGGKLEINREALAEKA